MVTTFLDEQLNIQLESVRRCTLSGYEKIVKKKRGVGNDRAERGVKLGRDFLSMARTEEKFRNICL